MAESEVDHFKPLLARMLVSRRSRPDEATADRTFAKANLRPPAEFLRDAERAEAKGDVRAAVTAYVIAGQWHKGATLALKSILATTKGRAAWDVGAVAGVLEPLQQVQTPEKPEADADVAMVLALSAYIGMLRAIWRGYHPIVFPLLHAARDLMRKCHVDFGVSDAVMSIEACRFMVNYAPSTVVFEANRVLSDVGGNAVLEAACRKLLSRAEGGIRQLDGRADVSSNLIHLPGAMLPSSGAKHDLVKSFLTKTPIRGPRHVLGDRESQISQAEAIMWFEVNHFSPLGNGSLIEPF